MKVIATCVYAFGAGLAMGICAVLAKMAFTDFWRTWKIDIPEGIGLLIVTSCFAVAALGLMAAAEEIWQSAGNRRRRP
jgi:hypothetical protein